MYVLLVCCKGCYVNPDAFYCLPREPTNLIHEISEAAMIFIANFGGKGAFSGNTCVI